MGSKYVPTIRDLRAADRYHKQRNPLPGQKKAAVHAPAKKAKKR